MDVFSVNALIFTFYFITPAIIAIKVRDWITPADGRKWSDMLFELISYSGLNLILYTFLTPLIHHIMPVMDILLLISKKAIDYPSLLWISFILPILFGLSAGIVPKLLWVQKFFRGLILHPEPTAWDYLFSDRWKCYGILFHLKSGEKFGGVYGSKSYVSSYPHPKEIYIEKVCEIDEKGTLLRVVEKSEGAFISIDECSLIELFYIRPKRRPSIWEKITKFFDAFRKLFNVKKELHLRGKDAALLQSQTSPTPFPSEEAISSPQLKEAQQQPIQVQITNQEEKTQLLQPLPLETNSKENKQQEQ